jgi:hypothetical protein
VQFPADAQETELSHAFESVTGGTASIPADQLPSVSVSNSPRKAPGAVVYDPTAVQFPAEAHETEPHCANCFEEAAFAGRAASTPADQLPAVSVSSSPSWLPELST